MSETPDKGSILGPTFQCLIAYQFSLYKQGDRFWYERKFQENPVAAFTRAELAEIKKTTYSKILCSVMNNIGVFHSLQPRLMLRSNIRGNSPLSCKKILRKRTLGLSKKPFAKRLQELGGKLKGSYNPLFYFPLNPGMRSANNPLVTCLEVSPTFIVNLSVAVRVDLLKELFDFLVGDPRVVVGQDGLEFLQGQESVVVLVYVPEGRLHPLLLEIHLLVVVLHYLQIFLEADKAVI
uniref:Peroxidasin n=1 Tax=Magallana gigas TaxID=29159 RepID=K1RN66_MAGGI